jgi:hypothetical protein
MKSVRSFELTVKINGIRSGDQQRAFAGEIERLRVAQFPWSTILAPLAPALPVRGA